MTDKKQKRKRERQKLRKEAVVSENHAERKRQERIQRVERDRERVLSAEKALRERKTEEQKFTIPNPELNRLVLDRAPKLMDLRFREALTSLGEQPWCRPVEAWGPKGKSPHALFKSLAKHLLVQYTMPEFMYSVFFAETSQNRCVGTQLFVHLGQGGSLYQAVKNGQFPVPFTKRMCHVFLGSTVKLSFLEAIRHAQVDVFGGDRRLAEAISATRFGRELMSKVGEEFWSTVIQWTCNQAMLAPSQVSPIFDWVSRQRQEALANARAPSFSMKGRTGVSVLRAVEEWHGQLARERKIHGHQYVPSGIGPWVYERQTQLPNGTPYTETHTITEILSSKELSNEGRVLRHCVYSYSWMVLRGGVSIWSYKVDGERVLTLEVDNKTRRVVQCRGQNNRLPTASEKAQVARWVRANNLTSRLF